MLANVHPQQYSRSMPLPFPTDSSSVDRLTVTKLWVEFYQNSTLADLDILHSDLHLVPGLHLFELIESPPFSWPWKARKPLYTIVTGLVVVRKQEQEAAFCDYLRRPYMYSYCGCGLVHSAAIYEASRLNCLGWNKRTREVLLTTNNFF